MARPDESPHRVASSDGVEIAAHHFGAEDPSPATFAEPLADVLPHGRALAYDHLGHFGPFQEPDHIADDAAVFVG